MLARLISPYRARDAPNMNTKQIKVVLCVWFSVHRERPFRFVGSTIHQAASERRKAIVGIHQPTTLYLKQELHRQHPAHGDAKAHGLH